MPTFLFAGFQPETGYEPHLLNLNTGSASLVRDFVPGSGSGFDTLPSNMISFKHGALFTVSDENAGTELWFTDGTSSGSFLLKDIAPGIRSSYPDELTLAADGQVYFFAENMETGRELWVTDGTTHGTRLVGEVAPGDDGADTKSRLFAFEDGVVFEAYSKLWYADADGLIELNPAVVTLRYADVAVSGSAIFFNRPLSAPDELWVSNGTPEGATLVFGSGNEFGIHRIRELISTSDGAYFQAEHVLGHYQIYYTDGTAEGTVAISRPSNMPINSLQSRGELVFFSEENAWTTWMYSPATGLQHFPQYEMGATSEFHAPDGSVLLTSHNNETGKSVLLATDGTPDGTIELMSGYSIRVLSVVDGVVYVSHRVEGQEVSSAIDGSGTLISTADLPDGANWGLVQLGAFESGTAGRDWMTGGAGDDTFLGLAGGDRLRGQGGDDVLKGNGGRDVLYGADGHDLLEGGAGRDRLLGGRGNDTLKSGTGNDMLVGSSGHDFLQGQKGDDVLTGGRGRDTFVFNRGDGNDTITDFELGIDQIEIGRGAFRIGQLDFDQQGNDVVVAFRNVEITIENTTVDELLGGDHFLFV